MVPPKKQHQRQHSNTSSRTTLVWQISMVPPKKQRQRQHSNTKTRATSAWKSITELRQKLLLSLHSKTKIRVTSAWKNTTVLQKKQHLRLLNSIRTKATSAWRNTTELQKRQSQSNNTKTSTTINHTNKIKDTTGTKISIISKMIRTTNKTIKINVTRTVISTTNKPNPRLIRIFLRGCLLQSGPSSSKLPKTSKETKRQTDLRPSKN